MINSFNTYDFLPKKNSIRFAEGGKRFKSLKSNFRFLDLSL